MVFSIFSLLLFSTFSIGAVVTGAVSTLAGTEGVEMTFDVFFFSSTALRFLLELSKVEVFSVAELTIFGAHFCSAGIVVLNKGVVIVVAVVGTGLEEETTGLLVTVVGG